MMLLQASEILELEGRYPSQIVLRHVTPSTYATHIKVLPPNAEPYFVLGHYFFKREQAEVDFQKRLVELEGPQSHPKS
jgi:hypothetical protein